MMTPTVLLTITEFTTLVSCVMTIPIKTNILVLFALHRTIHLLYVLFYTVSYMEYVIDSMYIRFLHGIYSMVYLYTANKNRLKYFYNYLQYCAYDIVMQFVIYSVHYWKMSHGITGSIFSFDQFQLDFLSHHQMIGNQCIHVITIFSTLVSIMGLVHHQVRRIDDIGIQSPIILVTYYCTKYSVDIQEPFENMLYMRLFTTGFMICVLIGFTWIDCFCKMNAGRYMLLLCLSVLLQEMSHIMFSESAIMYNYSKENGDAWLQFPLHGYFLVPLISGFFTIPRVPS